MSDVDAPPPERRTLIERREDPNVKALEAGDSERAVDLLPEVYEELRRLARAYIRRQAGHQTLQATDLVHEAYARLSGDEDSSWNGRVHFLAVAAVAMKQLLVDRARSKGAAKRGGDWERVTLAGLPVAAGKDDVDILDLHQALEELAKLNARQARITELRYFGGLTVPEVAEVLGLGKSTVEENWTFAKAWLRNRLSGR